MSLRARTKQQTGAMILIVAGSVSVVLSLAAYVFFSSSLDLVKAELQAAADAAAIAGAETFDGSKDQFNRAIDTVQTVLARYQASGGKGDSTLLVDDVLCTVNPAGNEFDCSSSKNLRVKIERGMWFPNADDELEFLSMEGSFPSNYPGIPQAVLANSVKVEITRPSHGPPFALPWLGNQTKEVRVTATARAGIVGTVCTAPFALPICALLDGAGEFHKERMCAGDRIFTQVDRYCSDNPNNNCGLVPSFEYGPCSPGIFDFEKHFTYPDLSEELYEGLGYFLDLTPGPVAFASEAERPDLWLWYDMDQGSGWPSPLPLSSAGFGCGSLLKPNFYAPDAVFGDFFDDDIWEQYSESEYTPPFFTSYTDGFGGVQASSLSDSFGVVGLPGSVAASSSQPAIRTQIEGLLGNLMDTAWAAGSQSCAIQTDIGDTFIILDEGLRDTNFDQLVWDQITRSGGIPGDAHPAAIDTVLGTLEGHRVKGLASSNVPVRGSGLCKSRRVDLGVLHDRYDSVPGTFDYWNFPAEPFWFDYSVILPYEQTVRSVVEPLVSPFNPLWPAALDPWGADALVEIEDPFTESIHDISGQRMAFEIAASPSAVPGGVSDQTSVWKILVPVIADMSSSAASCEGLYGSGIDPVVDPSATYNIVGFVEVVMYDVDVSAPPAQAAGPLEQAIFSSSVAAANEYRTGLNRPLPPVTPGDPGPPGWYFNDGTDPIACNLVRGRISCNAKFVTTSKETTKRIATLVD